MKFVSTFLVLFAISASAQASTLHGSWTSSCIQDAGSSSRSQLTFSPDGIVTSVDTYYSDAQCRSAMGTENMNATYTIHEDSQSATVFTLIPSQIREGEPSEMKLQVTYSGTQIALVKVLAVTVIMNGQKFEIPASDIDQIPAITYTRK